MAAKVSIVIPCYNQARLLPRAISSCLRQSFQDFEIIVVDDGSPDDVRGAAQGFADPRVSVFRQDNQGLSAARNTGLARAKGEFVKFLDADDWLLPQGLELQVSVLEPLRKRIALMGYRMSFEGGSRADEDVYPTYGGLLAKLATLRGGVNVGPPHVALFRTEDVRVLGGFDTSSRCHGGHEDYDLLCRVAGSGYEAVVIHEIGCVYRQAAGSMSAQEVPMRRTRVAVWRHFAECLLQTNEPKIGLCLLEGYANLLGSDILADHSFLARVVECIRQKRDLSDGNLHDLFTSAGLIIARTPFALGTSQRVALRYSAELLTDLALDLLVPFLERLRPEGPAKLRLSFDVNTFALALIRRGFSRQARRLLSTMGAAKQRLGSRPAFGLFLSDGLSRVLPGRIAAVTWTELAELYGAMRGRGQLIELGPPGPIAPRGA